MDMPKQKPGCDMKIESEPKDVNQTGYNEEPAKYAANPRKGFWSTICRIFNQEESP